MPQPNSRPPACACLGRRHFLGGFVALACSGSSHVAFAQTALCPTDPAAVIVRPHLLQPSYDYSLAIADLARITAARAGPKGTLTQHGKHPAGLTTANFETNWLITLGGKREGKRSCMKPTRVEVDIRLDQHKVYVARDATQVATCKRDVVLEHENRHVRINLDCVEDAKRRVEQALRAFVPVLPVMEGENISPQVVGERYKQMLAKPIGEAFDGALAAANAKHAAMDTNEAYARDWGRCAPA
ncbi:MAG: hypothetical protein HY059_18935 [Proteobacteria bacterium]|nr:hypothetical protein [Pseudomonadota bacterium]